MCLSVLVIPKWGRQTLVAVVIHRSLPQTDYFGFSSLAIHYISMTHALCYFIHV